MILSTPSARAIAPPSESNAWSSHVWPNECAQGRNETRITLQEVPITRGGVIGFQVENVMASVAAAWAVGLDWDKIRLGLKTFVGESDNAPGRFNVFDYRGATLIADYGHNPDAMLALVRAVDALPARRRVVMISAAGDRRDEDIRHQTRILGDAFDEVVLYQDAAQRGRADGEVIGLLRQGLAGARRVARADEVQGEFAAIDAALARLSPGDLCLLLIDRIEEALAHIAQRVAEAGAPDAAPMQPGSAPAPAAAGGAARQAAA